MIATLLAVAAVPGMAATSYLGVLSVLAMRPPKPARPLSPSEKKTKFAVVVPAHNEEGGIASTIASLRATDWPESARRIVVVADNCTDRTALRATEAGAEVLERFDEVQRGKGYALAFAFERLLQEGWADALVVIDADTVVDAGLFAAFAAHLAEGDQVLQANYGVRDPETSWRTRLMTLALSMFHVVRSRGRERLGFSIGLHGNGMCFRRDVLERVPHDATSVVEDLEYGLRLGEAGIRIAWVEEAGIRGEMAATEKASRSQRLRWERGRRELRATRLGPLFRRAIDKLDPVLLDLAAGLAMPPLSSLGGYLGLGVVASSAAVVLGAPGWVVLPWVAASVPLVVHFAVGVSVTGFDAKQLASLAIDVPSYVAWKLVLPFRARFDGSWVRTTRRNEAIAGDGP